MMSFKIQKVNTVHLEFHIKWWTDVVFYKDNCTQWESPKEWQEFLCNFEDELRDLELEFIN